MPLLITSPTNIRYLTGFIGVDKRDAYVLLTKTKKYLFTNSLYLESAKKLKDVTIVEISKEKPIEKELAKLTKSVGFEENDLTVAEFNKLKKVIKTLIPTKNKIEDLRMIKREDEIGNIRQAAKLTDQCFRWIIGKLKPGISEGEIAWEIESFFRKNGTGTAFSPIVAFGKNTSQPHYSTRSDLRKPQGQTLSQPDIVLLDFGARVLGYCADMTRVVFIGKPKEEWKKAYRAVFEAQLAALVYLDATPMPSGAEADRIARKRITDAGFPPYPHSLGHSVGLAIHEGPRLSIKKDAKLKPGMAVTVEPGMYKEGQYGIRIEDLILLKKSGIETLSQSPKGLTIL